MTTFENIILISADDVSLLRRCDVFRVVNAARGRGCVDGFIEWLAGVRPDLADEAYESLVECLRAEQDRE